VNNNPRDAGAVEVKICGITNAADACAAIECGADSLGFNLFPGSKRFIDLQAAADWIRDLPNNVRKVAVMVNPDWNDAMSAAQSGLFDCLQLHGDETSEFCRRLSDAGVSFIKALPMANQDSLQQPIDYSTGTLLLDSRSESGFGGSGQTFPWSLARPFVELHSGLRILLAGGLTPQNVRLAIESVRPAGVDVTSGVEADFGRKDRRLVEAFIAAARAA
jgi:phosphoribosylanthranilate isomerase